MPSVPKALLEIFKNILGLAADIAEDVLATYFGFLRSALAPTMAVLLLSCAFLVVGLTIQVNWMVGVPFAAVGICAIAWFVLAFPILVLGLYANTRFDSIRKATQIISGLVFTVLAIIAYFLVVPVSTMPNALPILLVLGLLLVVSYIKYGTGISPGTVVTVAAIVLVLMTIALYMPKSTEALKGLKSWLDSGIAEHLAGVTGPEKPVPQHIDKSKPFECFGRDSGEPILWFRRDQNGELDLFDAPGFHPQSGKQLLPITPEVCRPVPKLGPLEIGHKSAD